MHLVFIMDEPETIILDEDTSFALMWEAQQQGDRIDHCLPRDLYLRDDRLYARVRPAELVQDPARPMRRGAPEDVSLHDVDAVLIRKDPPFDPMYLWMTQLLEWVRADTVVANDPRGLREANEKLYACHFREVMPQTLVSSDKATIKEFMHEVGGKAVIKPLHGAGGEGIFVLSEGDLNTNALIETTTYEGTRLVIVQEFIPAVETGDKRILLLDGEPLGAILRVPQSGELRSNIHVGGSVVASELDETDRRIVGAVAPRVREDGLWFVGLDVIGGKLTEVNVTSPTGIQQMSRLMEANLSGNVVDALHARVRDAS